MVILKIYLEEQLLWKPLYDKAFHQEFRKFFDKKSASLAQSQNVATWDKSALGGAAKSKIMPNLRPLDLATRQLAEELLEPSIRKLEKLKIHLFSRQHLGCWSCEYAANKWIS